MGPMNFIQSYRIFFSINTPEVSLSKIGQRTHLRTSAKILCLQGFSLVQIQDTSENVTSIPLSILPLTAVSLTLIQELFSNQESVY